MSEPRKITMFFELLAESAIFEGAMDRAVEHFHKAVVGHHTFKSGVEAESNTVVAALSREAVAAQALGVEIGHLGEQELKRAAEAKAASGISGSVGGGIGGAVSGVGSRAVQGLLGTMYLAGGLTAVFGGLLALTEHLVNSTAEYSANTLKQAEALGFLRHNVDEGVKSYQIWNEILTRSGIATDVSNRLFTHFNAALVSGSETVKRLRLDTHDLNHALDQLADNFHNSADAQAKDAIARELFGRGSVALVPILNQGSSAIKAYGEELEKFGLILDRRQLSLGAAASVVRNQWILSLEGAERQVTIHVMPAFLQFFTVMEHVTVGGGNLWKGLGDIISNVISFIAGLIAGLTGKTVNLSEQVQSASNQFEGFGGALDNTGDSLDAVAQKGNVAADILADLREQTRHQTDAIQDQIGVLRTQQSAYDDRIRQNDLLQQQQDDLHQSYLSQLQDQLDQLKDTNDDRRHSGEAMLSYERRLRENQLQNEIKNEQATRARAKTTQELVSLRFREETDARIKSLESQSTALQRHLADEEARVKTTTVANVAAFQTADNQIARSGIQAMQSVQGAIKGLRASAFDTAQGIGNEFHELFTGKKKWGEEAEKWGEAIGEAIAHGIYNALSKPVVNATNPLASTIQNAIITDVKAIQAALSGNKALSGIAPGFASGAHIWDRTLAFVGESGGETVLPHGNVARSAALINEVPQLRAAASLALGGGGGLTANFYGPVADHLVAARVVDKLASDARRRGLTHSQGRG